jgi:hypothetical protein
MLGTAEAGERDEYRPEYHQSVWEMKQLGKSERAAWSALIERLQCGIEQSRRKNTGPHPENEREPVESTGDRGDARCPGTESAKREADAEHQPADELRDEIGLGNVHTG